MVWSYLASNYYTGKTFNVNPLHYQTDISISHEHMSYISKTFNIYFIWLHDMNKHTVHLDIPSQYAAI